MCWHKGFSYRGTSCVQTCNSHHSGPAADVQMDEPTAVFPDMCGMFQLRIPRVSKLWVVTYIERKGKKKTWNISVFSLPDYSSLPPPTTSFGLTRNRHVSAAKSWYITRNSEGRDDLYPPHPVRKQLTYQRAEGHREEEKDTLKMDDSWCGSWETQTILLDLDIMLIILND